MKALPAIFIGNSYRKQLFDPFLKTKTFGKRLHIYLNTARVLKKNGLEFFIYKILISFSKYLVLSDGEAAEVIQRYAPKREKKIFWFGWNMADDLKEWPIEISKSYSNLSFAFLYPDAAQIAKESFHVPTSNFKFPVLLNQQSSHELKYLISFLGDADIREDFAKKDKKLDDYLWECSEKSIIPNNLNTEQIIIIKNRIRFFYAKKLKKDFGKDFLLVGNDWVKYGLDSLPADYDPKNRTSIYSQSKLCLDLGSKSSMNAHYPRSAEIISQSNGIVQLRTTDSKDLFGDQLEMRTFSDYEDLKKKIDFFINLKPDVFADLGNVLRTRVSLQAFEHNQKNYCKNHSERPILNHV